MSKGQVFTPPLIADLMVNKLFKNRILRPGDRVLDPGCGRGVFIEFILRWCKSHGIEPPEVVGVELDEKLVRECRKRFDKYRNVMIIYADFLKGNFGRFDYIICNPPYVRLEEIIEKERELYRRLYEVAVGRFNLYELFFEKAIKILKPRGRLVFITPENFEYKLSAVKLRRLMTKYHVEELHHLKEYVFSGLVLYPTITVISKLKGKFTKVINRDGSSFIVELPRDGSSWISVIRKGSGPKREELTLGDVAKRISCGVATGADEVFIVPKDQVPSGLLELAYPTVSGRDLTPEGIKVRHVMIIPYDRNGRLLPEDDLKDFLNWASKYMNRLKNRYCVKKGKRRWYEFHEIPPMGDILRPKILCKDITKEPAFWLDEEGTIVPRHSTYYIVPKDPLTLHKLYEYLNSEGAREWLIAHAQRAANDFIRLQSQLLKRLPVPSEVIGRDKGS